MMGVVVDLGMEWRRIFCLCGVEGGADKDVIALGWRDGGKYNALVRWGAVEEIFLEKIWWQYGSPSL